MADELPLWMIEAIAAYKGPITRERPEGMETLYKPAAGFRRKGEKRSQDATGFTRTRVAACLAAGKTQAQTARALGISAAVVSYHVKVLRATGVID